MHISGNGENTATADSRHRRQGRNADDRYSQSVIVLPEREVLTVISGIPAVIIFKIIQQAGGAAGIVIFIEAIDFKIK